MESPEISFAQALGVYTALLALLGIPKPRTESAGTEPGYCIIPKKWKEKILIEPLADRLGCLLPLGKAIILHEFKTSPFSPSLKSGVSHSSLCFSLPVLLGWIWEVGVKESVFLLDPPLR